jgi:protein SCO1
MMLRRALLAGALALAPLTETLPLDQSPTSLNSSPISGRSLYNLEETWTNQDGASKPLASLRGAPVVAAMGYTTCRDICPAVIADVMWIEKHLKPELAGRVRFVFFSLDSEADTPERMTLYMQAHGLKPDRWSLYSSDVDAVRVLAAALGVGYRPDGQRGFNHSAVIALLDTEGDIVFQQRGAQASSNELLARLNTLLSR